MGRELHALQVSLMGMNENRAELLKAHPWDGDSQGGTRLEFRKAGQ